MIILCRQIMTSLSFSGFMAILEQSGCRIPDAQSVKLKFSLKVIFNLTKTENRTKRSQTQLSHYCLKVLFSPKKMMGFCTHTHTKNAEISKIKRALVLKVMFSKTAYVCTYEPSTQHNSEVQVSSIIITSFRQGVI